MAAGRLASIITVNYNGRAFLSPLLESLLAQTYEPKEIIVVDNASTDGSIEYLHRAYPQVKTVQAGTNRGFAGGNNLGFRHCRGEYVALINNDAVAEPEWLASLVQELERHPEAAAAGSKIVFLKPFVAVRVTARGGPLLVDAGSRFMDCDYAKPLFVSGWTGASHGIEDGVPTRQVGSEAELWLPVEPGSPAPRLRIGLRRRRAQAEVRCCIEVGHRIALREHPVDPVMRHLELPIDPQVIGRSAFYVINNAGSRLDERGNASDRGIGEADRGQYDQAEAVEALCGCAMLLRRDALQRAGGFDESFFMYYEDTDLCWRLRKLGYRLRYQPKSIVRHVHAGSSREWSPFFTFHVARNRVLISLKNASWPHAVTPLLQEGARTLRCLVRCARAALTRRALPPELCAELAVRLRVQRSLAALAPKAFATRWRS